MAGPTRDESPDGDDAPGDALDDAAVDARWAELTAALGELRMPEAPEPEVGAAESADRPVHRPAPPGPRDYSPEDDDEDDPASGIDGFEAPDPGPLDHTDPALTLGWVGVVGSVVVGLLLAIFWSPVPTLVLVGLGAALVGGVALLLWRMPTEPDDSGPGDGAVV
ncbi:hypothetical protein [Georgenia subflava]|uniref:Uncharacterized protein n=1 Tax=Georgenia subflava TaxID=1622177 RepID=A0A6N7ELF4_9MICO|nr:hypothetical protein [Georgenia subflava]MPV37667.1 hypothetical protein [Georgenia subflava]